MLVELFISKSARRLLALASRGIAASFLIVNKSLHRIYDHAVIKHNQHEYVNGRIHTNTIEGFWSLLKRGIFGIYHFTSKKHLQKYVDEFVFRYNTRNSNETNRFNLLLSNSEFRLTYKELIK